MLELHWLALSALATAFTFAWLFVERRITTTTILAATCWSLLALSGGSLERITETGTRVSADVGYLVWVCTLLAILSMLAGVLYVFGHYPPEDTTIQQGDFNDGTRTTRSD